MTDGTGVLGLALVLWHMPGYDWCVVKFGYVSAFAELPTGMQAARSGNILPKLGGLGASRTELGDCWVVRTEEELGRVQGSDGVCDAKHKFAAGCNLFIW
ncbi:hypothetical protein B0H63DRAFT_293332 [Podospora didyma]|uniref:Uncharacterized protein n=1 Tax=Podospora didyma TaxID=330526 RepID=A0AAE0N6T0_9PEZI|nr:hypothetical protein B0H63DRAFT_293332 [Podospora didyma]